MVNYPYILEKNSQHGFLIQKIGLKLYYWLNFLTSNLGKAAVATQQINDPSMNFLRITTGKYLPKLHS